MNRLMNRLWVRLTVAFMLITLLTVGTVAWLADRRADAEFRAYLLQPGSPARNKIVDQLADYYAAQQSWDGVGDFAETLNQESIRPPPLLRGGDVLATGVNAGPRVKQLLEEAYDLQLEGRITTVDQARAWLNQRLSEPTTPPPPGPAKD